LNFCLLQSGLDTRPRCGFLAVALFNGIDSSFFFNAP